MKSKKRQKNKEKNPSKNTKTHKDKFEAMLTKESRQALAQFEIAAKAEAKIAKLHLEKFLAELEVKGKETLRAIIAELDKDKHKANNGDVKTARKKA